MPKLLLDEEQTSTSPKLIESDISSTPDDKFVTLPQTSDLADTEWTSREEDEYVKKYRPSPDIGPEQLKQAGVPDRVIEEIDKNNGFMMYSFGQEDQPLEAGAPIPFAPTWRLYDKIGSAVLTGLGKVGGAIASMYRNRGVPQYITDVIKYGSDDEIRGMQQVLKNRSTSEFGDELLFGGTGKPMVSDNFFERRRFFNTRVPRIESQVRETTEQMFKDNPELQKIVSDAVDKTYGSYDDAVKSAYKKVEELGNDKFKYNVEDLRENLLADLADKGVPEEVIRNVKRNLFYLERNLTPAQRSAQRQLPKLEEAYEDASSELAQLIPGRKSSIKSAKDRLAILEHSGDKAEAAALRKAIKKAETAKTAIDKTFEVLPDLKNVGEKEYIRLIDQINRKKFVGGGDISKNDLEEQKALTYAKRYIEDFFEKQMADTNPELVPAFKAARKTYADKIKQFGPQNKGNKFYPELGRMVPDNYNSGKEIDIGNQIDTLLKSPYKIKQIGEVLEKQNPGISKQLVDEWLNRQIGVIKQGDRNLLDLKRVDLPSLREKLDLLVSDPRKMRFIEDMYGPQKAKQVEALHSTVSALKNLVDDIGKEGAGSKSAWEVLSETEGKLGLNKLGKSISLIRDFLMDKGAVGGKYSTEVLDRIGGLLKRRTDAKTAMEKSRAEQVLQRYLEDMFTGEGGGAFGKLTGNPLAVDNIINRRNK